MKNYFWCIYLFYFSIIILVSAQVITHGSHCFYQVDPFLHLVEDSKLQAAESSSGNGKVTYGSNEDDSSAQKCLSQINITEEQSTQSMISLILKSLSNLSDVNVSLLNFVTI